MHFRRKPYWEQVHKSIPEPHQGMPHQDIPSFPELIAKSLQDKDLLVVSSIPTTKFKSKVSCFKRSPKPKSVRTGGSAKSRIYAFIDSLFNNEKLNKSKTAESSKGGFHNSKSSKPSTSSSSTCSSTSSFLRGKLRGGIQRALSMIVDDEDSNKFERPPLAPNELSLSKRETTRKHEEAEASVDASKSYYSERGGEDLNDILDQDNSNVNDGASESTSDLFGLDHLGENRFCQLPVYETFSF